MAFQMGSERKTALSARSDKAMLPGSGQCPSMDGRSCWISMIWRDVSLARRVLSVKERYTCRVPDVRVCSPQSGIGYGEVNT